jgi:hypothetical protein
VSPVYDIHYVECDVPPGQTLSQWRRERVAAARRPPSRMAVRRRAAVSVLRRAFARA